MDPLSAIAGSRHPPCQTRFVLPMSNLKHLVETVAIQHKLQPFKAMEAIAKLMISEDVSLFETCAFFKFS